MTFGLDETGFTKKRVSDLTTDLNAKYTEQFGDSFLTTSDTPAGKIIGIDADQLSLLWEGLQAIFDGLDVASATGVSQDRLYALNGLTRQASQPSTVPMYLGGTPATIVTTGATVSIENTNTLFQATGDITLGAIGTVSVTSITRVSTTATVTTGAVHGLTTGDVVFIRGADQTDYNILATVTVSSTTIFDYTVANSPTTPATGTITMIGTTQGAFEAVVDGPTIGVANTINTIETTITGWDFAENLNDATVGRNDETDAEFRSRRLTSLALLGAATFEAILAALLNTSGVTGVTLLENDSDITDGDGLPPHSIRALVIGGADADIAQTLFDEKGAGIATSGSVTEIIVDSQGENHTINFSRLTAVTIHIEVTVTKNTDPGEGPTFDDINGDEATGVANIKAALVAFGATLDSGNDVVHSYLISAVGTVQGMSLFSVLSGTVDPPLTTTNITIATTELADIDTANIDVLFI